MTAPTPEQATAVDPSSIAYRVHAHAFNTLTKMMAGEERFVPLSERDAIASAIVAAIEPLIRADERAAAREPQPAPGDLVGRLDGELGLIRDTLESLCRRDGLSLGSAVSPGEPAMNYELADRLGIGHVFGLKPQAEIPAAAGAQPAPVLAATEALYHFAENGKWLTCTEDGTLDMRAELLAVKAAVREAFDAAARPAEPAPELAANETSVSGGNIAFDLTGARPAGKSTGLEEGK